MPSLICDGIGNPVEYCCIQFEKMGIFSQIVTTVTFGDCFFYDLCLGNIAV
jgi:hypothetical protein